MDRRLDGAVMRATAILLTAGLSLVAVGTAGVAASLPLVLASVVLAGVTRVVTDAVEVPATDGVTVRTVATDLWIGPALAAVVLVLWLDATPGEVQALGGMVGLVGMLNYFLRPFYHLIYELGQRLAAL
jgi:hypothetical protein